MPLGAEITGLYVQGNDLFLNVQHPSQDLPTEFAKATVGVIYNFDVAAGEHSVPSTDADKHVVASTLGHYQILMQEGSFGPVSKISGAGGEMFASNDPDFNGFVPTGADTGYLFTNWENRPGGMSRVHLTRAQDGTWSADEASAMMVDFGGVFGTWVNCFGTVTPWNTPYPQRNCTLITRRNGTTKATNTMKVWPTWPPIWAVTRTPIATV